MDDDEAGFYECTHPHAGEVRRNKANPSVAQRSAKRALEVPANDAEHYELSTACQIGLNLMAWDSKAGLPVAKTLVKRVNRTLEYSTGSDASRGGNAVSWKTASLRSYCLVSKLGMQGSRRMTDLGNDHCAESGGF